MKTVLVILVLIVAIAAGGYFGLPILIQKETAGIQSGVDDTKQRLLKIEEYMKKEEEARKAGQLPPDADLQRIIKTANDTLSKMTSLETSYQKEVASLQEAIKKQGLTTEEVLKKQSEILDKSNKEIRSGLQRIGFNLAMTTIRGNLLKVQIELKSKNIGMAKSELDLINDIMHNATASVSEEQKKAIQEFQGALKKAKDEMDANLPAAINRVDLLWHEIGKWIRKP